MSEKRSLRGIGGPGKKPTQINEHLNKQKEDDCLKELWRELDDSEDGQEIDPEDFLRNMTILDDLVPLPSQGEDWNLSWKDFEEKYGTLLDGSEPADQQSSVLDPADKSPNCKRPNCKRVVAVFLAVVLVLALLTSCGFIEYMIRVIAEVRESTFGYSVTEEIATSVVVPELPETKIYASLEKALNDYNLGMDNIPKRWPEGTTFDNAEVMDLSESIKITADYWCEGEYIGFAVRLFKDSDAIKRYEAEMIPLAIETYIQGDIKHYILDNTNTLSISWIVDTEVYLLMGSLSLEQAKQMINSIYEG